jgi:hypothetical protein
MIQLRCYLLNWGCRHPGARLRASGWVSRRARAWTGLHILGGVRIRRIAGRRFQSTFACAHSFVGRASGAAWRRCRDTRGGRSACRWIRRRASGGSGLLVLAGVGIVGAAAGRLGHGRGGADGHSERGNKRKSFGHTSSFSWVVGLPDKKLMPGAAVPRLTIAEQRQRIASVAEASGGETDWSGRRESNPRHSAWEADVLPLNYTREPCVAGSNLIPVPAPLCNAGGNAGSLVPTPDRTIHAPFEAVQLTQGMSSRVLQAVVLSGCLAIASHSHPRDDNSALQTREPDTSGEIYFP